MEFIEKVRSDGSMEVHLVDERLPAGMRCRIIVFPGGWAERATRANGNGSIRYAMHPSYEQAQAAAVQWAKRKIAGR